MSNNNSESSGLKEEQVNSLPKSKNEEEKDIDTVSQNTEASSSNQKPALDQEFQ